AARVVADADDLAVADRPQHTAQITHLGGPQVDLLHGALGVLQVHVVADGDDVLEQHHHSGHEVLDDGLGADAGGQTDDAQRGDHRRDLHPDHREDHDQRDRPHHHAHEVAGDVGQGLGPLLTSLLGELEGARITLDDGTGDVREPRGGLDHGAEEAPQQPVERDHDHRGGDQDHHDLHTAVDEPAPQAIGHGQSFVGAG